MNRTGKIARLPRPIRTEINSRLDDGQSAPKILPWLNAHPEVQAILAADFNSQPITEQNLSHWRQGGYRDWLAQQEALEIADRLAEDAREWNDSDREPVSEALALWLGARYAAATRQVAKAKPAESWRLLREMCKDIVALRRGDHRARCLRAERARLAFEQERDRVKTVKDHTKWALMPENIEYLRRREAQQAEEITHLRRKLWGEKPANFEAIRIRAPNDPAYVPPEEMIPLFTATAPPG